MIVAFLRSCNLQLHVIYALFMREIYTRFGRENIGWVWIIGEPVLFCVGVAIMYSLLRKATGAGDHGISLVAFIITGYNGLTLWRHCVFRAIKAFESNGSLLFHRQVTTVDIITARLATEFYGSTVCLIVTGGGAVLLGYAQPPKDYSMLYMGWFYVMFFSAGCGFLFAGLSEFSEVLEKTIPVVTYVSIPLSGCFTMVDWVPPSYQKFLLFSPSVEAFEMVRGGWFGPIVRPHFDVWYTTCTCTLLLLVGMYVCRKARAYVLVA